MVIKAIAREPGKRSKIAVMSTNLDVDPVGACVGMKGSRVQMVVQELKGERIDIIPYSSDKIKFVQNSLKPAEVDSVELGPDGRSATLVVKDDQLSLAIGKGGLNAKLASELTGVHIDIVSPSDMEKTERETREMLMQLPGIDSEKAEQLMSVGIWDYEDVVQYGIEGLVETASMEHDQAEKLVEASKALLAGEPIPEHLLVKNEEESAAVESAE
ncbi:MAG: hypothetical protein UZ16_OP3001002415 [Candidatus Hinthialibacteria bacterium OLB16]|nr:MAG: hypothetical protein UZ16_OP3001002415 [Candidatus Hinthialibacteria bacterium OLB16]